LLRERNENFWRNNFNSYCYIFLDSAHILFSTCGVDVIAELSPREVLDLQQKTGDSVRVWAREFKEVTIGNKTYFLMRFAVRNGGDDLNKFLSNNLPSKSYLIITVSNWEEDGISK
jgi:hypothetical protein